MGRWRKSPCANLCKSQSNWILDETRPPWLIFTVLFKTAIQWKKLKSQFNISLLLPHQKIRCWRCNPCLRRRSWKPVPDTCKPLNRMPTVMRFAAKMLFMFLLVVRWCPLVVGFGKVIRRDPMFGLLHPDKKQVGPLGGTRTSFVSQIHPLVLFPPLGGDFPADRMSLISWKRLTKKLINAKTHCCDLSCRILVPLHTILKDCSHASPQFPLCLTNLGLFPTGERFPRRQDFLAKNSFESLEEGRLR